jgi:hypothetical protein
MVSSRLSRGIAWFALIHGLFCLISPLIALATSVPIGLGAVMFYLGSAGVSFTAGFFGLRNRSWAYWLLCLFFVLQLGEYESADRMFSLIGPVAMRLSWTLSSPPATITLNLFAVLLAVAAGSVARQRRPQVERPPQ